MNTTTKLLAHEDLAQFTGTEQYYKLTLGPLLCTDGVKYLADQAGAYWLIDVVASYQHKLQNEKFQVWKLKVLNNKGLVTAEDGNGKKLIQQKIPYTDFPLDQIELFYIDGVLLLTSEY